MQRPLIAGIGGGSGSGKTSIVQGLTRVFPPGDVSVIEYDWYYRDLGHLPLEERARQNFDHPDAHQTALLVVHLTALRQGRVAMAPTYDFSTHTRLAGVREVRPSRIVIVEGILALADPELRRQMDLRVFVDTPPSIRLARRIRRDILERGRTPESVAAQYAATVAPMHAEFVEPCRVFAQMVLSGEVDPEASIGLLAARIRELLEG